jgi:hypothetical protein
MRWEQSGTPYLHFFRRFDAFSTSLQYDYLSSEHIKWVDIDLKLDSGRRFGDGQHIAQNGVQHGAIGRLDLEMKAVIAIEAKNWAFGWSQESNGLIGATSARGSRMICRGAFHGFGERRRQRIREHRGSVLFFTPHNQACQPLIGRVLMLLAMSQLLTRE